jgi:hypothetical protein
MYYNIFILSPSLTGGILMTVIDKLACMQGRRDEVPNQELAKELAATRDADGIRELVDNLRNKDKKISSDCIKTLYEIGYIDPELITDYVDDFLKLLRGKNNRLIWGAMMALSTVAHLEADTLFDNRALLFESVKNGSVITVDNGIKTLSIVAAQQSDYNNALFPFLIEHLKTCRPKEVPQHAQSTSVAVSDNNKQEFLNVLYKRLGSLSPAQASRIKGLIKKFQ